MKMTLDETWKNCLSMYRRTAKEVRKHKGWKYWSHHRRNNRVIELKGEWVDVHSDGKITFDCFFCHYAIGHRKYNTQTVRGSGCIYCPAKKIDGNFDCSGTPYDYRYHPIAFYNKLVSLNRKRLKAKK